MSQRLKFEDLYIVQSLGAESVLYDQVSQKAHCLSDRTLFVLRSVIDSPEAGLVSGYCKEFSIDRADAAVEVGAHLDALRKADLISEAQAGSTRRDFLTTAMKLAATPLIMSVMIPAPAAAASCASACTGNTGSSTAAPDCVAETQAIGQLCCGSTTTYCVWRYNGNQLRWNRVCVVNSQAFRNAPQCTSLSAPFTNLQQCKCPA